MNLAYNNVTCLHKCNKKDMVAPIATKWLQMLSNTYKKSQNILWEVLELIRAWVPTQEFSCMREEGW